MPLAMSNVRRRRGPGRPPDVFAPPPSPPSGVPTRSGCGCRRKSGCPSAEPTPKRRWWMSTTATGCMSAGGEVPRMRSPARSGDSSRHSGRVQPNVRRRDERAPKTAPVVCWSCLTVRVAGRWSGTARVRVPAYVCLRPVLCPACQRIRTGRSAHVIAIEGMPAAALVELRALALRTEAVEVSSHPQERLVGIGARGPSFTIATTGLHLARLLLSRIRSAWKQHLETTTSTDSHTVLTWLSRRAPTRQRLRGGVPAKAQRPGRRRKAATRQAGGEAAG
jgi:hypothetical protein